MAGSVSPNRVLDRLASPWLIAAWALAVRLAAVAAVQLYVSGKGRPYVFPDTGIYWLLARQVRAGGAFVVMQYDVPHFALRTPGYPLFLAGCQALFGESFLAVRLVQAALGALSVWMLDRLASTVWPGEASRPGWNAPRLAALWAATDPLVAVQSALVLTEAVFIPLLVASLWGLAALWGGARPRVWVALATGAASGAAVLVRPSWAPIVPMLLLGWVIFSERRVAALRMACLVALGLAIAMGPWWVRNARIYGRFVPTALWSGASLYDGLRPGADGSSDMRFLDDPEIRALDEVAQDRSLRDRALDFARRNPGEALRLALVKSGRFWSPWPNEGTFRGPGMPLAGSVITIPFYGGLILGTRRCRRDARALVLLLGPLLGTAVLHAVFVGSIRYRIPVEVPAFGLAALGMRRVINHR